MRRVRFAEKAAAFCLEHGFDGLDMDWEYPAQLDGEPRIDKENHLLLLKELSAKFVLFCHNRDIPLTKFFFRFIPKGLLLTAAVASAEFSASVSYDIASIHKSVYKEFIWHNAFFLIAIKS